jgi:trehalose synthase
MLSRIAVGRYCCAQSTDLAAYRPLVGDALIDEVNELAGRLHGIRVCHVNATAAGGGVAELLERLVPIYRALGIEAEWLVIHGDKEFFAVTKGFHNGLQGAEFPITTSIAQEYLDHNRASAESLDAKYDVIVVHDPQPVAIRHYAASSTAKWAWRCHIDSSAANAEVWGFLAPYVMQYDAAIFTMAQFVPPTFAMDRVVLIPPAIDPFSVKNLPIPNELCRQVVASYGINLREPVLLQVSRFDPWKDPLGVIRAYQLVKRERPGVQLVLIGAMAGDDPEGWQMLETIHAARNDDVDIYVLTNQTGVGSMVVNAFQRGVDVVIQKSLREGFGLVVSEALWKSKPVVAGAAGGIPMQFPDDHRDFLVTSVEECADKVLRLLENPQVAREFGAAGAEHVRKHFLLPRMVRDELRLLCELLKV